VIAKIGDSITASPSLCPPRTAIDFRRAGLRQGFARRNLGALRMLDRLRRALSLEAAR